MTLVNLPGVDIASIHSSYAPTVVRGLGVGLRTSLGALGGGGNWSVITRKVLQSKRGFFRCKAIIPTFYQPTPTPLVDVELTAKTFQMALEPVAKLALTGLAASPKQKFLFNGQETAVYGGPGTNPKGYIESDWLVLNTGVAKDSFYSTYLLVEDTAKASASLMQDNSGGSSFINRYEGSVTAAATQAGTLLTLDSLTAFSSTQLGGSTSVTHGFLLIDYDAGDVVPAIDGDSTGQGVGEGGAGTPSTSDVLGDLFGNTGWIARGINTKLGLNYAVNMSKASDGTKYKALSGAARLRWSLLRRANPSCIFDGDGINDLSGNGSNRVKTWAVFNASTNYSYNRGDVVVANSNLYLCVKGGSSATSGTGPAGTTAFAEITDGGARWVYLLPDTTQGRIAATAYAGKLLKYDQYRIAVPGIQISSTMVGPLAISTFPISGITSSGTTATATHSGSVATGAKITISGATPTAFNGTYTVTAVDSTHFTYTLASDQSGASATGTLAGSDSFATVANQVPNFTPVTGARDLLNGLFRRQPTDPTLGVFAFYDISTIVEYDDGTGVPTGKWAVALDRTAIVGTANFNTADGTHQCGGGHDRIGQGMQPTLFGILGPKLASFTVGAASGSDIVSITGLIGSETITNVYPNDGRLAVKANGSSLIVGLTASSAGTTNYTLLTSLGRTLQIAITAAPSTAKVVSATDRLFPLASGFTTDPGATNATAPYRTSTQNTTPAAWQIGATTRLRRVVSQDVLNAMRAAGFTSFKPKSTFVNSSARNASGQAGETNNADTIKVGVSYEYNTSTLTQWAPTSSTNTVVADTFSGSATANIPAGGQVRSDGAASIPIPATGFLVYYEITYVENVTNPGTGGWPLGPMLSPSGSNYDLIILGNDARGTVRTASWAGASYNAYASVNVTVELPGSMVNVAPILFVGDGPVMGTGNSLADQSFADRAVGMTIGTATNFGESPAIYKLAQPAEQVSAFIGTGASKRRSILQGQYFQKAVIQFGSNDLVNGRTDAQLKADTLTLIQALLSDFPGIVIELGTLLPRRTADNSADPNANFKAYRNSYNAWTYTQIGANSVVRVVDFASVVENTPASQAGNGDNLWKNIKFTTDYTHLSGGTSTSGTSGTLGTTTAGGGHSTVADFYALTLDKGGLVVLTDTAPVAGVPKLGTYAYNTPGSVGNFFNYIGKVPFGGYGDAHIGRGYGKTDFAGAADDWVNSTDYVIDTCGWKGPGRELRLAMPLICLFGTLADAAAGTYDTYYTQIFTKIKNKLKPTQSIVRIRLGWEFNSTFQPWGTGSDATKQANYVTAFKRAVDIARTMNDANFTFKFEWVMNPGSFDFVPCYPGDTYVDYIGMDCYPGLNYKTVYRAPEIITPQAQTGIWDYMRTQQYGMQSARDFADARGKPFIIPEFAIEWNDGQVHMDAVRQWCVSGGATPVESFGWWNDSDTNNVVSGISGILTQTNNIATGQKALDIPTTGACLRNWFNPAQYPTQPQTPAGSFTNRIISDLTNTAWSKSTVNITLVSGETDPDGLPVYKMAPKDTTTSNIKRTTMNGKCPVNVDVKTRVLVAPDGANFFVFNGPEGLDTGRYVLNLTTGAFAYYTANNSGTAAQMAARVTTPVKRGNYWDFTITGKTRFFQLSPLLHMQPSAGDEMAYIASLITDGVKFGRVEMLSL